MTAATASDTTALAAWPDHGEEPGYDYTAEEVAAEPVPELPEWEEGGGS